MGLEIPDWFREQMQEEAKPDDLELWPEHADVFSLLCHMQTQLLCGPGGAYGLNYAVLDGVAERAGIARPTGQAWNDFRTLEAEFVAAVMER